MWVRIPSAAPSFLNASLNPLKIAHLNYRCEGISLYDVIIVGAGPAGSIAARRCASLGLNVIIVEKERIPRTKTCAGAVSTKALNLIGTKIPSSLIERNIRGLRFFSPNLHSVSYISNKLLGISTMRDKFDAFLTKLAVDEGCELIDSDPVTDIHISIDKAVCRLQSGRSIQGQMVIGADGANGITAKKTNIRNKWKKDQVGLCLETSFRLDKEKLEEMIDPEIYESYFIGIPLGYAWLLPKKTSVSIGIGAFLTYLKHTRSILVNFCDTISKLKKINIKISQFRAHLAPAGGFSRNHVSNRVLLVGDAAGFIDPLTGEGIYYSMKSGLVAADACEKAIEENRFSNSYLTQHYSSLCRKTFEEDLGIALSLTYKIHDNFDLFFELMRIYSCSSSAALARGEINYRILRRKILSQMPKTLLSFLIGTTTQKLRSNTNDNK